MIFHYFLSPEAMELAIYGYLERNLLVEKTEVCLRLQFTKF